jgi:hypothetical protein
MEITKQVDEFEAVQYIGDNADEVIGFIGLDAEVNDTRITVFDANGEWYVHIDQWVLRTLDQEILGTVDKDHFWESFATVDEPLED